MTITSAELEQMKAPWLGLQAEGAMLGKHAHELLRLIAEVEALQAPLREMVDAFWHIRRLSRPQQAAIDKARAALGINE